MPELTVKRNSCSPQAYCEEVVGEQRVILERIRAIILKIVDENETIHYGMLAYPGTCHLAAQKHHVAIYLDPRILSRYRDAFPGTRCGKSCIRFTRLDQLNEIMIEKMIRDANDSLDDYC